MNGLLFFYAWRPFDYDAETGGISDDGDLATRRLMDWCFKRGGSIPDDDSTIARLLHWEVSRWQNVRDEVVQFFIKSKGILRHRHIDAEIRKAHRLQEARSLGAQLANAKRALTARLEDAERPVTGQSAGAKRAVRREGEEDKDRERKSLDASASPVSSPLRFEETTGHSARKVLWTRVKKLKVEKGAVGRQLRDVGLAKVAEALDAIERTRPDDPTPFFVACCQDRVPNGHDEPEPKRSGPKEPLTDEARRRILARMHSEDSPHENPQTG